MSPSQKFKSTLRVFIGHPLSWLVLLYVVAFTCSMAAMEILSWSIAFFVLLFSTVDRFHTKKHLELHRLGVELPLVAFIVVALLGLRLNASEGDFINSLGSLRNLCLLFFVAFALQVTKNLNRVFGVLLFCATVVAIYAVWQHFTGIDLWRAGHQNLVEVPWGGGEVLASAGFFSDNVTYGHAFMMILMLPWASLLLAKRASWSLVAVNGLSFLIIFTSLIFSFGRGVWIAVLVALLITALFASRKIFIGTLLVVLLAVGVFSKIDPHFKERAYATLTEGAVKSEDRRKLWEANVEMFHDHPWIGVGYQQNEPLTEQYYKKLGIADGPIGHAHSNYVELLSTTGFLGFASYMLLILSFIMMTARLYSTIPSTHYWHKVFALSALGAQIAFHVGGLMQWNWGNAEVQHQLLFWLATVAYMSHQYYAHIVPDDHSL